MHEDAQSSTAVWQHKRYTIESEVPR